MIRPSTSYRFRSGLSSLTAFLLIVAGLAGVAAAPKERAKKHSRPTAKSAKSTESAKTTAFPAPPRDFGSIDEVESYIERARESTVRPKTAFLESYLWRLKQRAYPNRQVNWSAYQRAMQLRDRMPAAKIQGSLVAQMAARRGVRALAGPKRWEFFGPNNLPVPYRIYYGEGATSGRVNGLAYDPLQPNVYWLAAAGGGVWKSVDAGQTWNFLSQDWPSIQTSCIAVDPVNPNTVYVGTGDFRGFGTNAVGLGSGGIMKTTDGGQTWTMVGRTQFGQSAVSDLVIDPESPSTLVATSGRGTVGAGQIWRSTDAGQTWTAVLTTPAEWSGITIGARGSTGRRWMYAVGHANGGEVWRSGDRGQTWTELTPGLGTGFQLGLDVAASLVTEETVYLLSGTDQKVYKSTDAGNNWTDSTNNFPNGNNTVGANYNWSQHYYDFHITCSTAGNEDVVYVGLIDLAVSTDSGANWRSAGETFTDTALTHNDQHSLAVNPRNPNEVLVGNDGGVYRMLLQPTSGAVTFDTTLNTRLGITQFYTADYHPTDPTRVIGGTQDNATPVALGDLLNWRNVCGGDGAGCQINPANPNNQYASSQFQNICRTNDAWTTIQQITPNWGSDRLPFIGRLVLDPNNPNILYAGTNFLWRYDAGSDQWTPRLGNQELAAGADNQGTILAMAVAPSNSDFIYTGSDRGELWMTSDRGTSWTQINSGLPNRSITSIAVSGTDPRKVWVTVSGTAASHLWRTDNAGAGATWTDLNGSGLTGLPDVPTNSVALHPTNSSTLFVGNDLGVFRSTDDGQTWENMTQPLGLPNVQIHHLKVVPGTGMLMAATFGRGMWRIDPGASQQSVEITAPNGNEIFLTDQQTTITWDSLGFTAPHSVRLELSRDGGVTWETIAAQTDDDGSFDWTTTTPASDTARIRITSLTDPTISDTSDANFRVVEGSFRVHSPNGGEVLRLGERFPIEWEATGFALTSPRVKIELSRNGGTTWETLFGSAGNDGTENWTVSGNVTDAARIRITPTTLPVFADSSDGEFRIRVRPEVSLVTPNGGEKLRVGDRMTIEWNAAGFDGRVRIELSRTGGGATGAWETIFPDTANDGRESWTVSGPGTTSARLRITSIEEPEATDLSNGLFGITAPTLTLTAPTQGHTTVIGGDEIITWRSTGLEVTDRVRIELSRNGGVSWQTLEGSTENDGSAPWSVTGDASDAAVIRITSLSDGSVVAVSPRFNIRRPDIFLVNPNGRNRWFVGNLHDIAWSGTVVGFGTVDIELSRDGGRTWKRILRGVENDGAVRWGVRGKVTNRALVRVIWNNNTQIKDQSNGVFRIRRGKPRLRTRRR